MRITIIPPDGVVGVDGVFRQVSMAGIDPAIHAIQFDTTKGAGEIEYRADATVEADVRDEAAERAAEAAALEEARAEVAAEELNSEKPAELAAVEQKIDGLARLKTSTLAPIMKKAAVRRGNERLVDFAAFQVFVERWTEAAPKAELA